MSPLVRKRSVKKPTQTIGLLDIGSGSVGYCLIEIGGERPEIVSFKRLPLRLGNNRTAAYMQIRLLQTAREALAALHAHSRHRTISHLAIFLPAPWSVLDLHSIRFSKSKAFLADTKLVRQLIAEHARGADQAVRAEDFSEAPYTVFERAAAGIKFNGYVTLALPENAKVLTIELMLGVASVPTAFLERLRGAASAFFGSVTMHSTPLAGAHALSRLLAETKSESAHPESFLLCDGEGEIAEIIAVRGGIPEARATIPVGYSAIVRTLAAHGGFTHEEISSALALARDPRSLLAEGAGEAIALAQKECAEMLGNAEYMCASYMPTRCFIIGDGPEAQWFAGAVVESPRLRAVLPKDFAVQVVTAKSITGYLSHSTNPAKVDVMLGLEALYAADRFGNAEAQEFSLYA